MKNIAKKIPTALLLAAIPMVSIASETQDVNTTSEENHTVERKAYRAYQTPVNYNFGEVGFGLQTYDLDVDTAYSVYGRSETMVNEHWIFGMDYTYTDVDGKNFNSTGEHFIFSGLYRHGITNDIDFVVGGSVGYITNKMETLFGSSKDQDISYGGSVGIRQGVTDKFEVGFKYVAFRAYDDTYQEFSTDLTYYVNEYVGFGMNAGYTNVDNETSVNGYVRFRMK